MYVLLFFVFVGGRTDILEWFLPELRRQAIEYGLMDEDDWLFSGVWQLEDSLETIEWRRERITATTPPYAARFALPSSKHCYEMIWQGRLFLRWIDQTEPFCVKGPEQWHLDALRNDTKRRIRIWETIRECNGWAGREGRRLKMQQLMEMVGEDVWESHQWPDVLPPAARNNMWRLADEPANDD